MIAPFKKKKKTWQRSSGGVWGGVKRLEAKETEAGSRKTEAYQRY